MQRGQSNEREPTRTVIVQPEKLQDISEVSILTIGQI